MDKAYTPLGSLTLAQIKSLCKVDSVVVKLTDEQLNIAVNAATIELATFLEQAGKEDYYFDSIGDGDLVLSPTPSALANTFEDYLHLKFGVYNGTASIVSQVAATKLNLALSSAAVDVSGELAVYTINISGGTITGDTSIEIPTPVSADIQVISTTQFKVYKAKSHAAFSIWIKKMKES